MKLTKLTAFPILLFASALLLGSCEKDAEKKKAVRYEKTGIVMSGAQVVPASTSAALGSLDVTYVKGTQALFYKFTWSGLSGNPTGIGVYGLAPVGFGLPPSPVLQTIPTTGLTTAGSYSGSLLVDGVVVKEENLLSGLYYIAIRTAASPAGEIRGQVRFQ